jgi:hypothetical protein
MHDIFESRGLYDNLKLKWVFYTWHYNKNQYNK